MLSSLKESMGYIKIDFKLGQSFLYQAQLKCVGKWIVLPSDLSPGKRKASVIDKLLVLEASSYEIPQHHLSQNFRAHGGGGGWYITSTFFPHGLLFLQIFSVPGNTVDLDPWSQHTWVQILTLPLTSCVLLGKWLFLSKPLSPYLFKSNCSTSQGHAGLWEN